MPDGDYYVATAVETLDAQRRPVRSYPSPGRGPYPGNRRLAADLTWTLILDGAAWPISYRDVVTGPSGVEIVVDEATLSGPYDAASPLQALASVTVRGHNRHGAQPREAG